MMLRLVMQRAAVVVALGLAVVAGACGDKSPTGGSNGNGAMIVKLTDAPFLVDSVQSVDVFVVRVDARAAAADSATAATGAADDSASAGGWITLASPNTSVNLLAYQNGAALPLDTTALPAGSYAGFRMVIDPTKSSITLKNGMVLSGSSTPGVVFPSGARTGIKITLSAPVVIAAADTTTMLVDFDVANSFVLRGTTILQNGLLFKPVVVASVQQ